MSASANLDEAENSTTLEQGNDHFEKVERSGEGIDLSVSGGDIDMSGSIDPAEFGIEVGGADASQASEGTGSEYDF